MNYYKNNQSKTQYINHLQRKKSALDTQGLRIQALLGDTGPYLGGFLDSSTLTVANVTDARKDQWMQFEFNRDLYQRSTSQKGKSEIKYASQGRISSCNYQETMVQTRSV